MSTTQGEKRVAKLLKTLPSHNYYVYEEPLIAVTDSARRNPDFVVVSRELGVIVIEVKDVAITEIKQKTIKISGYGGRDVILREETSPVVQARDYKFNLMNRYDRNRTLVSDKKTKPAKRFGWTHMAIFTQMSREHITLCEDRGIWEKGRAIGREDLVANRLEEIFRMLPWEVRTTEPLDQFTLDALRATLDPGLIFMNDSGEARVLSDTQAQIVRKPVKMLPEEFLSKDAERVIETPVSSTSIMLIRGVAGSGKTLILAKRAEYLAENYPEASMLVLTLNSELVEDLRNRLETAQYVNIFTPTELYRRILGSHWREPSPIRQWLENRYPNLRNESRMDLDFVEMEIIYRKEMGLFDNAKYLKAKRTGRGTGLQLKQREIINIIFDSYRQHHEINQAMDWVDVRREAAGRLKQPHPLSKSFDFVLVDEAHNLEPSALEVIKEVLKLNGHLFLCEDQAQSTFKASYTKLGIGIVGNTKHLKVPFRCTHEITEAAYSLITSDPVLLEQRNLLLPDLKTYELRHGARPQLFRFASRKAEAEYVRLEIERMRQRDEIPAKDIAIVHHPNHLDDWAVILARYRVRLYTPDTVKGHEFKYVFVPQINLYLDDDPAHLDEAYIRDVRKRLFIALSRAKEQLTLSHYGTLPPPFAALLQHVQYSAPKLAQGS